MRGPPFLPVYAHPLTRITPACAGTTLSFLSQHIHFGDHPRMCGDHVICRLNTSSFLGSPPHVRGPQILFYRLHQQEGITPACAGTTSEAEEANLDAWGSPPHVRGPLFNINMVVAGLGITPACAGTTITRRFQVAMAWDHPRMCGDHRQIQTKLKFLKGSPPHVRGPPSCLQENP